MKKIINIISSFILFLIVVLFVSCNEKNDTRESNQNSMIEIIDFDQDLADSLGADEYGMRKYVMAFLKSGPNRSTDSLTRVKLQRAHLDNISKLAEAGKLSLAGPFLDDGPIRGIYIFNVESLEEAETLTKTDPAIQAGSLIMELHPWYGSAALMEVKNIHEKIAKTKI